MTNGTFLLEIVSPDGVVFSDEVDEVSLPTADGEITILPHHADLYSKLTEGEAVIHKKGKKEFIAVLGGFIEVNNNKVTVLSDYAVPTDKIVLAKAQEAKDRAEKILKDKESTREFAELERDLQKSIMELNIAEKAKKRNRNI